MALQLSDLIVIARGNQNYQATLQQIVDFIGLGQGTVGPAGIPIPGYDGEDGLDGITVQGPPGPTGATGNTGPSGRDGLTIPGIDGLDSEDHIIIPGPKGDTGLQGSTGLTGSSAPTIWIPNFDEPDWPQDLCPAYNYEKNSVVYLGKITGTGVTVGPLTWNEDFDLIHFEYQIGGYNGGTPVGRLLCGSASISTTALTNGNTLISNVTLDQTSISKPGCPLAVTLSAIARSGWGTIRGLSGALKQIDIHGQSGNPAVGTAPTSFEGRSFFSDLGTNLPIKRLQLTVYDTLITTAASAQTFTATTYIRAWGIRNNFAT